MRQSAPEDLDIELVSERLRGCALGDPLFYFDAIGSTNAFLCAMAEGGRRHGTLVVADHQTSGRGRFGRPWSDSPGKSLLFSLLLRTARPPSFWPLLTLGVAGAICRVIDRLGGGRAHIRWPNDVVIEGKKVAGILTESVDGSRWLVLGVGLNVGQVAEDFPEQLRPKATSLRLASGRSWRRDELLVRCIEEFAAQYERWAHRRDGEILADCRKLMSTLGRPVRLHADGRTVEGVVMGLDADGGLVLREMTGLVSHWHSAHVEEVEWSAGMADGPAD